MSDTMVREDELLGRVIDELLESPPDCESVGHQGEDAPAQWWISCPVCHFRMAWCTPCIDGWKASVDRMAKMPPPGPVIVDCPSCRVIYPASSVRIEPI